MSGRSHKPRLVIHAEQELIERIRKQAEHERRTMTGVITFAIEQYLNANPIQEQHQ